MRPLLNFSFLMPCLREYGIALHMAPFTGYDPNKPGSRSGTIFGLPCTRDESELIIIPVPWDVTASYRAGSRFAPTAIFEASLQVDLCEPLNPGAWKRGIYLEPVEGAILDRSSSLREKVQPYLNFLSEGGSLEQSAAMQRIVDEVNKSCADLMASVQTKTAAALAQGKKVALLGGDHSTPLGFVRALAERHSEFGILQIDAHADLREAYEGFNYSHASIMWNCLKIPQLAKLVQVGVRDFCDDELALIKSAPKRIRTFFDSDLQRHRFEGRPWKELCAEIVSSLPAKVYVSFDIDGLEPSLCPGTGTPVPGGLTFSQAVYLIECVVQSDRTLIGFDLNEVAPAESEWDANVGARLLYKLANLLLLSS